MPSKRVCIVTPDIVGPVNNGGIGTHCFNLARLLVTSGYEVTVLFTGELQNKTHKVWEQYYSALGVKYFSLAHEIKSEYPLHAPEFVRISYFIYEFLKDQHYDFIHFQDWLANGLVTLQMKETTKEFDNTHITVTLHSPTAWQQEGMKELSKKPLYDIRLKWAEEYCSKVSDTVISPSQHMLDWGLSNGWQLCKNQKLLPYPFIHEQSSSELCSVDFQHLIFFGRLETRKGLAYFCETILKILVGGPQKIKKVSFIGKIARCMGVRADKYIKNTLGQKVEYVIHSNFDTFAAMQYIKETQGLVVIASLLDNYPFTIIEAIENKIAFICSNAGGIPEMVDNQVVFDIREKNSLYSLLDKLTPELFCSLHHKYDSVYANQNWLEFHGQKLIDYETAIDEYNPKVSICVPYFNYPKYLPYLLESVDKLNYDNYEVIIVNDGSNQEEANRVFAEMQAKYTQYKFYQQQNSGVGATRNYAAKIATGEYLVFMDSDNLATPNMIHDFVYGIKKTGADCLTCYFSAFNEAFEGAAPNRAVYKYLPMGACIEAGIIYNVFGDANFIIKKDVFFKLGGFGDERTTSWEDWAFLAKLNLEKYVQKVIPRPLFWYRHTEVGFSRNTNVYSNLQRVAKVYSNYYPSAIQTMISNFVLPYFNPNPDFYVQSGIFTKLKRSIKKLIEVGILPRGLLIAYYKARNIG